MTYEPRNKMTPAEVNEALSEMGKSLPMLGTGKDSRPRFTSVMRFNIKTGKAIVVVATIFQEAVGVQKFEADLVFHGFPSIRRANDLKGVDMTSYPSVEGHMLELLDELGKVPDSFDVERHDFRFPEGVSTDEVMRQLDTVPWLRIGWVPNN